MNRFVALLMLLFLSVAADAKQPNILLIIADDWGWPHAGAYGDPVVKTPNFDRVAKEGMLFEQAFVNVPSCTPCRASLLAGKYHWRLGPAANLWANFPDDHTTYPLLLQKAGYETGQNAKAYGPGSPGKRPIAGEKRMAFGEFLAERDKSKPFCFWQGSSDPHRGYIKGSGARSGMDISKVEMFPHYPDSDIIRSDVADYYWEVQRFDRLVGKCLEELEESGLAENTIVLVTGDHNMPFPRCKGNLYDCGIHVPLAIRWPAKVKAGQKFFDPVSFVDLAPTFLNAAGAPIPKDLNGVSLLPVLVGKEKQLKLASGKVRDFVFAGRERHCPGQEKPLGLAGYPCRAIRTNDFLYIRNFAPERWPAGTPNYEKATKQGAWLADCDNSPTKTYIWENRDKDDAHRQAWQLCFGKRPAEELYELKKDKFQMVNVADNPEYAEVKKKLAAQLEAELKASEDPRLKGGDALIEFDTYRYAGGAPKFVGGKKKKK